MLNYRNNQIGIAALVYMLVWSAPVNAQRADADQPMSLIGDNAISDPATSDSIINAPDNTRQPLEKTDSSEKSTSNEAIKKWWRRLLVIALPIPARLMRR